MTLNLFLPKSYHELTQKQIKWLFRSMVKYSDMNSFEFKILVFLKFSGLKILFRHIDTGDYIVRSGKNTYRISPEQINQAAKNLDWILFPPASPWRPERIAGRKTPDTRLYDLPFGLWLSIENYYQGYIATQNTELLDKIADLILPSPRLPLRNWEYEILFRWILSVKDFYTKRFSNFYSPVADDNSLGTRKPSARQLEDSMNAQIRALTKGDIAKEQEILDMPVLRALIELDAQAKEYQELKQKTKI